MDLYDEIRARVASVGFKAEPVPEFQELGITALSQAASQQFVELSAAMAIIRDARAEVERLTGQVREAREIILGLYDGYGQETVVYSQQNVDEYPKRARCWLAANPEPGQTEPGQGDKGGEVKA